ncbi:MAG: hypothetical protein K5841_09725 [Fretibacterium sp.]|nr:hypothetical protein [Fretibacterium sp.]
MTHTRPDIFSGALTRRITRILLCAALLSAVPALALPETLGNTVSGLSAGWRSPKEYVLPLVLTANSEDVGRWTQRIYTRTAPPCSVEVNLMEGSGPGPLRVPTENPLGGPEAAGSGRGVIQGRPEYRVLDVAGHRAVLERYPHLPLALSVAVGRDAVLTLESSSATAEELAALAEEIIENR